MNVEHLEIFVEEPSMETFLRQLIPRLLVDLSFEVHSFRSKQDLLAKLPARLRAYRSWMPPSYCLLVLVDRDGDDCHELKRRIEAMAQSANLRTLTESRAEDNPPQIALRIVVEELESWYFGDWEAVTAAYPRVPKKPKYCQSPDAIEGGTWEAFERVLQKGGYFRTGLRKIEAARAIGLQIDPWRSTSESFRALRNTLLELSGTDPNEPLSNRQISGSL